jgi:hypothetical protein
MSDENVAKLPQLRLDRCEISEQIANQIGISYRSFQNIVKENLSVLCVCVCVWVGVGACLHKICAMHLDRGPSRNRESDIC